MTASLPEHVSVMLAEVLAYLPLRPGVVAVDGTVGLAGHSLAIAQRIAPGGFFFGTDWDQAMLARARVRLEMAEGVEVHLVHANYRELPERFSSTCASAGRPALADAILLDLGLNNAQIEDPSYGISFRTEGPLDMRMDRSVGEPAAAVLNRMSVLQIEQMLWDLGDERWARRIAQVIVERRKTQPLRTTTDLVDCVQAAVPAAKRDPRLHPATRTFQAVRIYVNQEMEGLQEALEEIAGLLAPGGVMVVLAYHSGEDRAVKRAFQTLARSEAPYEVLTPKPERPSAAEVAKNPKSRSALLRALRRLPLETAS